MKKLPADNKKPSQTKVAKPTPKVPEPKVYTPEPPQVMDPSIPLEKQEGNKKLSVKDEKSKP